MSTSTISPAARYDEADRPLAAVLDAVPAAAWTAPSPCEGWTAADVVEHLIGTQRDFLAGHGLDVGLATELGTDPAGAWRDHARHVRALIADDAIVSTGFEGHFGPTTIGDTLVNFYVFDMVVHRWDIARAVGGDTALTDTELDRIESGADGFGPALYMEGVCRPGCDAPADADRQTRALARLGRPSW